MIISQIVAIGQNGEIGKDNDLIWKLPNDMKFFKQTTMGHHIIMGRKNYESINMALPGRTSVIITRNPSYKAEGCHVVHSLKDALDLAKSNGEEEAFIIGGGEIYKQSLDITDRIYLTEVHDKFEADAFYPALNKDNWKELKREKHLKDDRHLCDYSFVKLERLKS